MSKKQKQEAQAKTPVKLTCAEKKEIQAIIRKYKGDGKQADFRIAPRPVAQPVKPCRAFLVPFQPDKGHGLERKAPCLDKLQCLRELRECGP